MGGFQIEFADEQSDCQARIKVIGVGGSGNNAVNTMIEFGPKLRSTAVIDASNGSIVWSRELVKGTAVHGLLASPAYDGRALYVASASPPTGIVALRPADGTELWRHVTDLPVYSAPAVGEGVLMFGTGAVFGDLKSGSLIVLSTTDGRVLWSIDMHSAVRSGPALAGDLVVVGDNAGDLIAFRPSG